MQSVVLVAEGQTGLTASITSGVAVLGTQALVAGFNAISFDGMTTGQISMKVTNSAGATVISGTGPIDVSFALSFYSGVSLPCKY